MIEFTADEVTALYLAVKELSKHLGEDDIGAIMRTSGRQAIKEDGGIVKLCDKLNQNTKIK